MAANNKRLSGLIVEISAQGYSFLCWSASYGSLSSGNSGLVQKTATLYQSSAGSSGSPAAPPSHLPRTMHATPALRNANDVPSVPSALYAGISCHAFAEKLSRKRNAASPVAFARANDPEMVNPHPKTGFRSVSSRKVPVRRRIETPGVLAALAYATSQAARTSFGSVFGEPGGFRGAASADQINSMKAVTSFMKASARDPTSLVTRTPNTLTAVPMGLRQI
jgi:hypothetical protein